MPDVTQPAPVSSTTSAPYGSSPCPRCGVGIPWGTTHYCPTAPGGAATVSPYMPVVVPAATPTMWCALCCMEEPYLSTARQVAVTLVGLLWVCGGHVRRALDMASTAPDHLPDNDESRGS